MVSHDLAGGMLPSMRDVMQTQAANFTTLVHDLSTKEPGKVPQGDPKLSKIAQGVLYSQKLILTYHAVILALLLCLTLRHWSTKVRRAWRRRHPALVPSSPSGNNSSTSTPSKKRAVLVAEEERSGSSSSSSSTTDSLHGPIAFRDDLLSESTPLIPSNYGSPSKWRLFSRLRAFLMYQPPPIPFINKTLPSNDTTIFVLALIGLNIFYAIYACPLEIGPTTFILADRASVLFVANLPLLYLLAAKNQPIKFLTGYSYEALNIFHRRLGEILCLLALLHTAGMTVVWYTLLRPTGWTFWYFITRKIILLGLIAFVCYELLYFTSLASFRMRWYELFLVLHVVLQAAALVLVWFHHPRSRIYVGIALAIFLLDRLLFRIFLKTRVVQAGFDVPEDGRTALVQAKWMLSEESSTWRRWFGLEENYKNGWKPTQHIFFTVPALSRKHVFQAHPFTIASSPPVKGDAVAFLDLIVRAQDGFSKDLVEYAKTHYFFEIKLEGPYGSQSALHMLEDSDCAIVIAGGSGIAVAYPLVMALLPPPPSETDAMISIEDANKDKKAKKVFLIWVTNQASHASWITQYRMEELKATGVELIMPPPTAQVGRPDMAEIVEDCIARYSASALEHGRIGVVCSGPDAMNRTVRNTCASLVSRGKDVHVEIEKFGW